MIEKIPDPSLRHTKEYHDRLIERELYRLYRSDYPDMKWVRGVMDRLERKAPHGDYTDQDRLDFKKARGIVARIAAKHGPGGEQKEEERSTARYIWRTQHDGKVRPEHAANEGKIFAWDDPPPTGHPGEAFGCRCWAEPYKDDEGILQEFRDQALTDFEPDSAPSWNTLDYALHYRFGGGQPVTLHGTGNLLNVLAYASVYPQPAGGSVFNRFARDISEAARRRGAGDFQLAFEGSYDMAIVVIGFRKATIGGNASVNVVDRGEFLMVNADINYYFKDRFTDPLDWSDHSDNPPGSDEIHDDYGIPYDITDAWGATLTAVIKKDSDQSRYPDDEFGR